MPPCRACRLLLASCLLAVALPARAVIDKIEQPLCGDRRPTETIPLRNAPDGLGFLWVHGFGVDVAQRVTVSGVAGVRAAIGRRVGGLGSKVELNLTVPPDVADGDEGRVTLHYPLGEDSFRIKVFSRPQLASLSIDAPPSGPVFVLRVGREYTLTARGRSLSKLQFRPDDEMRRITSSRVESQNDAEIRIRVRALGPGRFRVFAPAFQHGGPACLDFGVVRLPGLDQVQGLVVAQ